MNHSDSSHLPDFTLNQAWNWKSCVSFWGIFIFFSSLIAFVYMHIFQKSFWHSWPLDLYSWACIKDICIFMTHQTINPHIPCSSLFNTYVTQLANEQNNGCVSILMQSQLHRKYTPTLISRINLGVHPHYHTGRVNEIQCFGRWLRCWTKPQAGNSLQESVERISF